MFLEYSYQPRGREWIRWDYRGVSILLSVPSFPVLPYMSLRTAVGAVRVDPSPSHEGTQLAEIKKLA